MSGSSSATGGPLLPVDTGPAPLEGQALNRFLQQWMVGITGLDGTLVRPAWQTEGPVIPREGTAWLAFGIVGRTSDALPYIGHQASADTGNGEDQLSRNERLDILLSFYDTGVNGLADYYTAVFRDGCALPQNCEVLNDSGFVFIECGEPITVPTLENERWLYRVDMHLMLQRMIIRNYPIRNLLEAVVDAKPSMTPQTPGVPITDDNGTPITDDNGDVIFSDATGIAPYNLIIITP